MDIHTYEKEVKRNLEKESKFLSIIINKWLTKGVHSFILAIFSLLFSKLSFPEMGPHDKNRTGGLYHRMVKQISRFTCLGLIWYIGETDENKWYKYSKLFRS